MELLAVASAPPVEGIRTHRVDEAGGQRRRVHIAVVPEHHELRKRGTAPHRVIRKAVEVTRVDVRPGFVPLVLVAEVEAQQLQNAHFQNDLVGYFLRKIFTNALSCGNATEISGEC